MYEDIRKKIETNYGKGNGDYEVEKDLYEMVPDRLPVDEDSVGRLAALVDYLVFLIDLLYKDKPYQRFYVLETVARVPYFSYISCLHYLETIGRKDNIGWLRIHWAEGWNELHHLLIMEELGGSKRWVDRFLAQHTAVLYYWVVVVLYFVKPEFAYNLSEQIEKHAYETYDGFLRDNEEALKQLPAPKIAKEYYEEKTFMFDDFQSTRDPGTRRPVIRNLYDVFFNIRNDEAEHFMTMVQAQDEFTAKLNPTELTDKQKIAFANTASINMVPNPYDLVRNQYEAKSAESKTPPRRASIGSSTVGFMDIADSAMKE
jgi:ubiquinol oxidase